jgi:D-Tyr-tRNAtyr deacylase
MTTAAPRSPSAHARVKLLPLTAIGVIAAALALAACGGSSSPSTSSAAKEQQAEVKFADFAKCLREHGIKAETATGPGGEGHGLRIKGAGGPAKMEAAQKACKKYQPEPQKLNLSPQEKVERAEAVEKFAKCMREHGIEVHASSSEGHVSIQIHGGGPGTGPNPESPAFQKAQSSCQGLLPFKKGPNGGPPPKQLGGSESHTANAPGSSSSESSFAAGG